MKTKLFVFLIAAFSPQLFADSFSLVEQGNQVCNGSACYQKLANDDLFPNLGAQAKFPESPDLVQQANAYPAFAAGLKNFDLKTANLETAYGAAAGIVLSEGHREQLVNNFASLIVRDVAYDKTTAEKDNHNVVPFYAIVDWVDSKTSLNKGRLYVQGHLQNPDFNVSDFNLTNGDAANAKLTQAVVIDAISDNTIDEGQRVIHFKRVGGLSANVDTDTKDLLTQIVGPATMSSLWISAARSNAVGAKNAFLDDIVSVGKWVEGLGKGLINAGKHN